MEELINKRVRDIEISGIRKFSNMVAQYDGVISLTLGQPDFPTPEHVKEAGKSAIDNNRTSYTHNAGLLELRKAAAEFMKKRYGLSYNPDSEVITTNGASEAIDTAFRTVLEEGSEVILPGPVYPGYEPVIKLCGAVPVYVDTRNNGFRLDANSIKSKLTDRTRCIVIPSPSNPTGIALSRKQLEEIAELLKDRNIFILSDEIYSELIFAGNHSSIAAIPSMWDKTIVINGLSKSHSMTGWRVGFIFAPEYISRHMIKVHQYNSTCASSISQYAAIKALTEGMNDPAGMRREYKERRDFVYKRLIDMGLETEKPEGAFYIFPSIKKYHMSSFDFALSLLKEARVAVVPGSAFSEYGEGYIRISYAASMEVLVEAMKRLESFLLTL